jgi:hypothetical protein
MVVAVIALVSSLAGTAVAAKLITSKQVKNGSLLAKDFKKGQLPRPTAAKIARGSITGLNSAAPREVVTLSVKAPARGYLSLNYAATLFAETPGTWIDVLLMSRGVRVNGREWWDTGDADDNFDLTQSNHVLLPVKKGRHTYSLQLKLNAGTARVHDARISAEFIQKSL